MARGKQSVSRGSHIAGLPCWYETAATMAEPTGASQSVFSGSISDLKKKKVPP